MNTILTGNSYTVRSCFIIYLSEKAMSLFIDVNEPLSVIIKEKFISLINSQRKDQPRPIRKICEVCCNYLDYGELRYDKMEEGITTLKETAQNHSSLHLVLMAVMYESLDEDQNALDLLTELSETSAASDFKQALIDFVTIGRFATIKQFGLLETAGSIIIERYSEENSITDNLSNLYLKVESDEFLPVVQKLLIKAREKFPHLMALESLTGFMQIKAKDYQSALATFITIKDKLLQHSNDNRYINENLAAVWDNIAICYLKSGDAVKTVESCDIAIDYDNKAVAYKLGLSILYKKAEAYLLTGQHEEVNLIANQILAENPEDESALEIKERLHRLQAPSSEV